MADMVDIKIAPLKEEYKKSLAANKGIIYTPNRDPKVKFKGWLDILGVRVGTYASQEEVSELVSAIVPTDLTLNLLRTMAEAYSLRQVLLLEGDPGVGKTYIAKIFVRLIHGKDAPILSLVGSPRVSEFDLFGHWAPKGDSELSARLAEKVRQEITSHHLYGELWVKFSAELEKLSSRLYSGEIGIEEFSSQSQQLCATQLERLWDLHKQIISNQDRSEWEFHEGALLRAYTHNNGRGYILIVDEFGLIPENYQQVFLQVVGEHGGLSDGITYFGNSGKTFYQTGQDTWICLVTNYPEKTEGRHRIVGPLVDRVVWRCVTPREAEQTVEDLILEGGGRRRKTTNIEPANLPVSFVASNPVEWWEYDELFKIITHTVNEFNKAFNSYYSANPDTVSAHGSEIRRDQGVFEYSARNGLRVFSYIDQLQMLDDELYIDFAATLERAFELYYVGRYVNESRRQGARVIVEQILDGETFKVEFEGSILTIREALKKICRNYNLRGIPQAAATLQDGVDENPIKTVLAQNSTVPERYKTHFEHLAAKIENLAEN